MAARLKALAVWAFASFVYAIAAVVWFVGCGKQRAAAEAIGGLALADALGPVMLVERARVFVFGVRPC